MRTLFPTSVVVVGLAGFSLLAAPAAQASLFRTILAPEVTGASGSGVASLLIDELTNQMTLKVTFAGLSGNTTMAHIHGPTTAAGTGTAGVIVPSASTLPSFPTGVKAGSYEQVFDLLATSTYRAAYITTNGGTPEKARDAFVASLLNGKSYLNVHSETFGTGEIRGFFAQVPVPGPLPLLGTATALGWSRRLRRLQAGGR
jgi:hypothetical protein